MGFGQNILCGIDSAIETKEVSLSVPKEDRNVVMLLDLPKNCAYEKKSNVMGDILVIFQRLDFKKSSSASVLNNFAEPKLVEISVIFYYVEGFYVKQLTDWISRITVAYMQFWSDHVPADLTNRINILANCSFLRPHVDRQKIWTFSFIAILKALKIFLERVWRNALNTKCVCISIDSIGPRIPFYRPQWNS